MVRKRSKSSLPVSRAAQLRLIIAGTIITTALILLYQIATRPPTDLDDACAIFEEKDDWYASAKAAHEHWGVPIHVQLAIIHQESSFIHNARPPRHYLLGFIPWVRPTTAYGYGQIKDMTWQWYLDKTQRRDASRDNFADVADFIGWYVNMSHRLLGLSRRDAYSQYLAYHEGQGGFRRKSYRDKPWLVGVARKVGRNAERYRRQLAQCRTELERPWWHWWPMPPSS